MYHAFYGLKVEAFYVYVEGGIRAMEYPHPRDSNKVYIESVEEQLYYLTFTNERATPIEVVISLDGWNPSIPNQHAQVSDEGIRIEPKSSSQYRASGFRFPREFKLCESNGPSPGSIGFAFWHIREDGQRGLSPLWTPVFRYESKTQLRELGIPVLNPELALRESSSAFPPYPKF